MDSHLRLPKADLDSGEHCVLMGIGHQDEHCTGVACCRNYTIPGVTVPQGIEIGSTYGADAGTFVASTPTQSLSLRLDVSFRSHLPSPSCRLTQLDTSTGHSISPGGFSSNGQ